MKEFVKVFSLLAIAATFHVNAGLITDYYLDGNIVKNDARGIEWLQWTETDGISINSALAVYQSQGWQLASQQNMADLFNDFDLSYGSFTWDTDERTSQTFESGSDGNNEAMDDRELVFVSLFGDTYEEFSSRDGFCGVTTNDCMQYSGAIFGNNNDGDIYYNHANVSDDYAYGSNWQMQSNPGFTQMNKDSLFNAFSSNDAFGVALIRTTSVPESQTTAILSLALLGLLARRRKR